MARLLPGDVSLFGTAVVANVLLSILLIWLVFLLGRRLGGRQVGLAAAVATALWPNLIFYSGVVLTETLFLVVLALRSWWRSPPRGGPARPAWRRMVAVGVLLGARGPHPARCRSSSRPCSCCCGGPTGWPGRSSGWRSSGRPTVAVLAPWSILSTIRMDSPVPCR